MITLGNLGKVDEFTRGLTSSEGKLTAYYCVGETCQLSVTTPKVLAEMFKRKRASQAK